MVLILVYLCRLREHLLHDFSSMNVAITAIGRVNFRASFNDKVSFNGYNGRVIKYEIKLSN